jgi:hypothetical protein
MYEAVSSQSSAKNWQRYDALDFRNCRFVICGNKPYDLMFWKCSARLLHDVSSRRGEHQADATT